MYDVDGDYGGTTCWVNFKGRNRKRSRLVTGRLCRKESKVDGMFCCVHLELRLSGARTIKLAGVDFIAALLRLKST